MNIYQALNVTVIALNEILHNGNLIDLNFYLINTSIRSRSLFTFFIGGKYRKLKETR